MAAKQLNFRMEPECRALVEEAAKERGVTLTREINDRLKQSFEPKRYWETMDNPRVNALIDLVARVIYVAGQNTIAVSTRSMISATRVDTWCDNPFAFDQVKKAVISLFENLTPTEPVEMPDSSNVEFYEKIGPMIADGICSEIVKGVAPPADHARIEWAARSRDGLGDQIVARISYNMGQKK